MALRVLIVDDHPSFRSSARALLEAGGLEVVGEAVDGAGGLAAARELRPDLVLLDVNLPDMDGFEVAARLAADDGSAQVVMTSSREPSQFGTLVAHSGACGFVAKDELSADALYALVT